MRFEQSFLKMNVINETEMKFFKVNTSVGRKMISFGADDSTISDTVVEESRTGSWCFLRFSWWSYVVPIAWCIYV